MNDVSPKYLFELSLKRRKQIMVFIVILKFVQHLNKCGESLVIKSKSKSKKNKNKKITC